MKFTANSIKTAARHICKVGGRIHIATVDSHTRKMHSKPGACVYITQFHKAIERLEPVYSSEWGKLEHQIAALVMSEVVYACSYASGLAKDDAVRLAGVLSVLGVTEAQLQASQVSEDGSLETFDLDRLKPVLKELKIIEAHDRKTAAARAKHEARKKG